MTDPVIFPDASPRFSLPFLYAAQAQKEFFLNEALARLDALVHCAVEGEATDAPALALDGENWIVAGNAVNAFAGQSNSIACRQQGQWVFIAPAPGMVVFDKTARKNRKYLDGWQFAAQVTAPAGGATIDTEARAAIEGLQAALIAAGILSN